MPEPYPVFSVDLFFLALQMCAFFSPLYCRCLPLALPLVRGYIAVSPKAQESCPTVFAAPLFGMKPA